MLCPRKFYQGFKIVEKGYYQCETIDCAWFNGHFGMCCIAVDAHLKATEDNTNEAQRRRELKSYGE